MKREIIVDLQKFHCKATPSLCQNNNIVDICIGCNHCVRFGSQTKQLVFTHPINIGDEAIEDCSKSLVFASITRPFPLGFQTKIAEVNKALIIKRFRDGTITSGCDCLVSVS